LRTVVLYDFRMVTPEFHTPEMKNTVYWEQSVCARAVTRQVKYRKFAVKSSEEEVSSRSANQLSYLGNQAK